MADVVIDTQQEGVRRIVLDRSGKRNALTQDMISLLIETFESEPSATERVVVMAANGPTFCAGLDLGERIQTKAPIELLCAAVRAFPLPVVSVVQGDAIAAGAYLALSADLVVASTEARFWLNMAQIGLAPPWPLARMLLDLTGIAMAKRMLLLGEPVSAFELAQIHCISSAVPPDVLDAEVNRIVTRLRRNAPLSMRAIKATLNHRPTVEGKDTALQLIETARNSDDGQEGMKARLEHRDPTFLGH